MPDAASPGRRRAAGERPSRERPDAWQAAVKQLAIRARSTHEVRQMLARRGYASEEIATAIAQLCAARYLDDAEFARTWVSTRAHRRAAGPGRLARELRTKGIPEADIAAALKALSEEWDAAEAAAEAARRKLTSLRGLRADAARRRLAAYLDRRGFAPDIILATCRKYLSDGPEPE